MKLRIVLAFLALGLVVACTSTSTGLKKFGEYPPRSVDAKVTVWLDGNPPADLVVASRLALLEQSGLAKKKAYQNRPLRYEYHLTEKGEALLPVLQEMCKWANKFKPGTWTPS